MSDPTAANPNDSSSAADLAALIAEVEPMGDLSTFALHDMTEEEETAFFAALENA